MAGDAAVGGMSVCFRRACRWKLFFYVVVLMTAFNFPQSRHADFPYVSQVQHGYSPHVVGIIAVIYNIGAILGGIFFGAWSERIGRRRAIIIAALLALPAIPLWAFSAQPALLAAGAFVMQFMVQGAWGIVPAHLNELSPEEVRGTFPGLVQLGNRIAWLTRAAAQIALTTRQHGRAIALVAGALQSFSRF